MTHIAQKCSNPDGKIYPPALGADTPCPANETYAPHYGSRWFIDMTDQEIDAMVGAQPYQKVAFSLFLCFFFLFWV